LPGLLLGNGDGTFQTLQFRELRTVFAVRRGRRAQRRWQARFRNARIDCGSTCSAVYDWNTVVTLTATPAFANWFMGWSGCDWQSGSTCVVTMQAEKSVTARFVGLSL